MTDLTFKTTQRGFGLIEFRDRGGEACTLQESSAMDEEGAIWFGAKDLKVQVLTGGGWQTPDLKTVLGSKSILGNERMHLTQSQVRDLLPILNHFTRTGLLPERPLPAPIETSETLLPCPFCGGTLEDGTLSFAHVDKYVSHAQSDTCSVFRGALTSVKEWNSRAPTKAGELTGLEKAHAAIAAYESEVDENVLFEGNEGTVIANARLMIEDLIEEAKA